MVLTAARDIPGGTVVRAADLEPVPFDPATVPTGVLESAGRAVGRTTAGPVRAGEPITDVRLLSGSLVAGYPGTVAVPLRIGDPGAVGLLRVGDRIDVVAADPQGAREPVIVAADVPVVALPRARETGVASGLGTAPGGLLVVAVPESTAPEVAAAGVAAFLSVVIRR
jgi:Flp pilus assembly protein CpaB